MNKAIQRIVFVSMFFMLLLIGSACSNNTGEEKANVPKNDINIRIQNDPDFLDPHQAEASITFQMILNMFDGLLAGDTDGSLKPAIATDYTISDDGLTYTFAIRDDVKFHNGEALTVDDIVYTFERLMGANGKDPLSSDFAIIDSLDSPDDHTFVIHLKEPNSAFITYLTALDSAIIPKSNDGKHNENPIGTGPFQFKSYRPGANLVLEKNNDYWKKGLPYLDNITFMFQPDDQSALLSLQAGDLDLMNIPSHRIPEVEDDFSITYEQANSILLLGYNQEKEPFNDVRVRQAINYAINRDEMIEAAFSGYAEKLGTNMSPAAGVYYRKGLEDIYNRDVKKAKQLLQEAGYPDGFQATITISSHHQMYANISQVAVENLKDIGIDLQIEVVEWGVWLEHVYQGSDFEMTVIDFTGSLSPYETMKRYISDASNNFFHFNNDEFDQLMKDVLLEKTEHQQIEMYNKAQEILNKEAAAAYIADYQFIWAMDPRIKGYKHYPFFFHDMSEVRFTD